MPIKLKNETLTDIAELVEVNDHGGAYLLVAKTIGSDRLIKAMKDVNRRHLAQGYLTAELDGRRWEIYKELLEEARAKLSEEDYRRLYAAL